jgi:hypothetical protein
VTQLEVVAHRDAVALKRSWGLTGMWWFYGDVIAVKGCSGSRGCGGSQGELRTYWDVIALWECDCTKRYGGYGMTPQGCGGSWRCGVSRGILGL